MDRLPHKSTSDSDEPVDLEKLGAKLQVISTGAKMKTLECPRCRRLYLRRFNPDIKYLDCQCGARIKLKRRWCD